MAGRWDTVEMKQMVRIGMLTRDEWISGGEMAHGWDLGGRQ